MFVISKTHVGMVRTVNEDALLTTGPELFALADGMGGYAAGETASREALQVLQQEAEKFKELTGTELCTAMRETVQQANKHIRQMAQNEIQYHDMGTTLVAVYLAADGKAYAVNVGDSRLYTWSAGTLQQVTRDHSYVAELLANGEITAQEAFKHPQKNIILRAVGAEDAGAAEAGGGDDPASAGGAPRGGRPDPPSPQPHRRIHLIHRPSPGPRHALWGEQRRLA